MEDNAIRAVLNETVIAEGCTLILAAWNDELLTALAGKKLLASRSITVVYQAPVTEVYFQGLDTFLARSTENDQSYHAKDAIRSKDWSQAGVSIEAIEARRFVHLVLQKHNTRMCCLLDRGLSAPHQLFQSSPAMEQLISELARVPMTVSNCTGSTNDLQQLRTPAAAEAAGCSTPVVRALVVGAMAGSIKQAADMIGLVLKVAACAHTGRTKTDRKKQKRALEEWDALQGDLVKKHELHQKATAAALIMRWMAEVLGSVEPISTDLLLDPAAACAIVQQIMSMTHQATTQLAGHLPHAGIVDQWLANLYNASLQATQATHSSQLVPAEQEELRRAAEVLAELRGLMQHKELDR